MIITVGGSIGSGKTTLAKEIANKFGLKHISAGSIMREMAKDGGMSLIEFSKYAESNPRIDKEIDKMQKELCNGNCVVDGRLSAYFLDPDFSIWLTAPLDIRTGRVMKREGTCQGNTQERIIRREKSERKRYKELYGIDLDNLEKYDLILSTGKFNVNETSNIISFAINEFIKKSDNHK